MKPTLKSQPSNYGDITIDFNGQCGNCRRFFQTSTEFIRLRTYLCAATVLRMATLSTQVTLYCGVCSPRVILPRANVEGAASMCPPSTINYRPHLRQQGMYRRRFLQVDLALLSGTEETPNVTCICGLNGNACLT
ncbi:hypothetical protein M758_UG063600 [Ceratodon purpureus]|nr:hypothetical protein M758_UG063600 [Ceratodon purpureus]